MPTPHQSYAGRTYYGTKDPSYSMGGSGQGQGRGGQAQGQVRRVGSSRDYPMASSNHLSSGGSSRYYNEKKYVGGSSGGPSSSSYNSGSSSHQHVQPTRYFPNSSAGTGGGGRAHHHSSNSSSYPMPVQQHSSSHHHSHASGGDRYNKVYSGGSSGVSKRSGGTSSGFSPGDHKKVPDRVRRVPPPLTPPGIQPLMKVTTSSSRYRQAPPEDRDRRHRPPPLEPKRRSHESSSSIPKAEKERLAALRKLSQKTAQDVTSRIRKRAAEKTEHESASTSAGVSDAKKVKPEELLEEGAAEVVDEVLGDDDDDKEKEHEEKEKRPEVEMDLESGGSVEVQVDDVSQDDAKVEKKKEASKNKRLKITCGFCNVITNNFMDYSHHLRSSQHNRTMSKGINQMKKKIEKLRLAQNTEQRELEKSEDGKKTLLDTTSFCRVCDLTFRTDPKEHEAAESHNEIKGLVHRRCELCDIDFKYWRVYLYHIAALDHVKKLAIQQIKENASVLSGTNFSKDELGMDLLEKQATFYCSGCVTYVPIKDGEDEEEVQMDHCISIRHMNFVEKRNYRIKMQKEREEKELARKEKEKQEKEKAAAAAAAKDDEKKADSKSKGEGSGDLENEPNGEDDGEDGEGENGEGHEDQMEHDDDNYNEENEQHDEERGVEGFMEGEEVDEDEIQLHAEEDDSVVN